MGGTMQELIKALKRLAVDTRRDFSCVRGGKTATFDESCDLRATITRNEAKRFSAKATQVKQK